LLVRRRMGRQGGKGEEGRDCDVLHGRVLVGTDVHSRHTERVEGSLCRAVGCP
jgi:hypothetical protein